MRSVLRNAVTEGEVEGVPDDLRSLAAVEERVERGLLGRKRGTFRKRCAEFFAEKYESGYVTPGDAENMAESWKQEAAIYGESFLAWVDAVESWYVENWEPSGEMRPEWPDAGAFHARSDPDTVEVTPRLVDLLVEARERGIERTAAVSRVSTFHPDSRVERAAALAFEDEVDAGGGA